MVFEEYKDRSTGQSAVCYGRIRSIIEHDLYPRCPDTLRHVLTECDWYTPTGMATPSGLLQVSLDVQLSSTNRWTLLKNMHRANVVLWPSYQHSPSFAVIPDTYVVITHTPTVLDSDGVEDFEDVEDE